MKTSEPSDMTLYVLRAGYLGGDPRNQEWASRERALGRGKVDKGYGIEIITVGNVCDTAVEWPF